MMTNYSNAIFLLHDKARMMLGIFEADAPNAETAKREPFKTFDPTIKAGDLVVVETGTRHHASVVKIVKADVAPNFHTTELTRWIISKIDLAAYLKFQQMETEAIEAVKQAELKKERADMKKTMMGDFKDELENLPLVTSVVVNGGVKVIEAERPQRPEPNPGFTNNSTEAAKLSPSQRDDSIL